MKNKVGESWEMVKINSLCRPRQWKTLSIDKLKNKGYPVYGANGKIGYYDEYTHEYPTLAITCRGATCGSVHITEPKSYINGNAMALDDISEKLDIKFLYYYFLQRGFNDVISGSAQPQITREGLSKVEIPLPPLTTQKRIAEILDAADALRRKDQELLKKYDELSQAIFIDMFGDPETNIKNWIIKPLSEICIKITDGTHQTPKYVSNGVPFLRVTDITESNQSKKYITIDEHIELIKRCNPEKGDILYTKNGTIGVAKAIDWDFDFSIFVSLCLLKINRDLVLPNYIETYLNTPIALKQAKKHSKTGTISNLHLIEIKQILVPVPPINMQEKFLNKVKNIKLSKEKTLYTESLFNSLLQKAFKGELIQ